MRRSRKRESVKKEILDIEIEREGEREKRAGGRVALTVRYPVTEMS